MRRFTEALVLTLMLAGVPAVSYVRPLINPVQQVVDAGLMSASDDGNFRAEATLSRAELATILVKTFKLNARSQGSSELVVVADVPPTHWAYHDIQTVVRTGLMTTFPGDRFLPDQPVTRAEGFAAIAQSSDPGHQSRPFMSDSLTPYPDAEEIPPWAKASVAIALSKGLVNLSPDNHINPQDLMTRGDTARALSVYLSQTQKPAGSSLRVSKFIASSVKARLFSWFL